MRLASWMNGLTVVLGLVAPAVAAADQALAQKNACLACHAVDKKLVGPAFQDVAKKYAVQSDAQAQLAAQVCQRVGCRGREGRRGGTSLRCGRRTRRGLRKAAR